ncbi:hypothetical protein SBBP2_2830005 [Burkholderiales bacterium]|nr:hypothetical protein SBBP2_2830005 [Burkholderiales bacterium]
MRGPWQSARLDRAHDHGEVDRDSRADLRGAYRFGAQWTGEIEVLIKSRVPSSCLWELYFRSQGARSVRCASVPFEFESVWEFGS